MTDNPQNPDDWQASDGKWYPASQRPGQSPTGASGGAGRLDLGAALGWGWAKFMANLGSIVVITIVIFVASALLQGIGFGIRSTSNSFLFSNLVHFIFWGLAILVTLLLQAGLIRMALKVARGESFDPGVLFKTDHLGPYVVASVLVALLSFVGLLFCCIGVFLVALFTIFYGFFVLDRNDAPVDSIKHSFDLVSKNAGDVVVLAILVTLINLFTCGLLIGFTTLVVGYAYRTLNGETVAA